MHARIHARRLPVLPFHHCTPPEPDVVRVWTCGVCGQGFRWVERTHLDTGRLVCRWAADRRASVPLIQEAWHAEQMAAAAPRWHVLVRRALRRAAAANRAAAARVAA